MLSVLGDVVVSAGIECAVVEMCYKVVHDDLGDFRCELCHFHVLFAVMELCHSEFKRHAVLCVDEIGMGCCLGVFVDASRPAIALAVVLVNAAPEKLSRCFIVCFHRLGQRKKQAVIETADVSDCLAVQISMSNMEVTSCRRSDLHVTVCNQTIHHFPKMGKALEAVFDCALVFNVNRAICCRKHPILVKLAPRFSVAVCCLVLHAVSERMNGISSALLVVLCCVSVHLAVATLADISSALSAIVLLDSVHDGNVTSSSASRACNDCSSCHDFVLLFVRCACVFVLCMWFIRFCQYNSTVNR